MLIMGTAEEAEEPTAMNQELLNQPDPIAR